MSGVPKVIVFGPLLFLLYTSVFSILENKLIGYADEALELQALELQALELQALELQALELQALELQALELHALELQ